MNNYNITIMNRRKEEIIQVMDKIYHTSLFQLLPNELIDIIQRYIFEESQYIMEGNGDVRYILFNIPQRLYMKGHMIYKSYAFDTYDFLYKMINYMNTYEEQKYEIRTEEFRRIHFKNDLFILYRHIKSYEILNIEDFDIKECCWCDHKKRSECNANCYESFVNLKNDTPIMKYQEYFNNRIEELLELIKKQDIYTIKLNNMNKCKKELT